MRWLLAAALVVVLALAVWLLAFGGDSGGTPAADATRLVPANALVYVHLSTDTGREGTKAARSLAGRFPSYDRLRDALLARLTAPKCGVSAKALEGREAALALLDGGTAGTAGSLVLVDTGKSAKTATARSCGGVQVQRIGRFIAVGQPASLQAARDLAAGKGRSLARDARYAKATGELPADRVLDAWVSQDGVRRLLAPQGGLLGAGGTLLDQPGLVGAAIGVTARQHDVRVTIRSELDGRRRQASGPDTPFKAFKPALQDEAPADALAYLGVANLAGAAQRLLAAGGSTTAGIGQLLTGLRQRLGASASARLNRDLLSLFKGESALILTPSVPAPTLTVIARTSDEGATRRALAALQSPLEKALTIKGAPAPTFARRGDAFQLRLATGVELDYAVFGGKLVVSTQLAGISKVRAGGRKLPGTATWKAAIGTKTSNPITSLVFLDFSQLLRLGEQTGLNDSRAYLAVKEDLQKVRAVGARSRSGSEESTAELTLSIP